MTPRDFTFWLHGYFELTSPTDYNQSVLSIVEDKLKKVNTRSDDEFGDFVNFLKGVFAVSNFNESNYELYFDLLKTKSDALFVKVTKESAYTSHYVDANIKTFVTC